MLEIAIEMNLAWVYSDMTSIRVNILLIHKENKYYEL